MPVPVIKSAIIKGKAPSVELAETKQVVIKPMAVGFVKLDQPMMEIKPPARDKSKNTPNTRAKPPAIQRRISSAKLMPGAIYPLTADQIMSG